MRSATNYTNQLAQHSQGENVKSEIQTAIDKLQLKPNDIIIVDPERVSLTLLEVEGPFRNCIVCVHANGNPVRDCINTVSLEELKKVVADMEGSPST